MEFIDYTNDPRAALIHFNPNHDPSTGRFSKGRGTWAHKIGKKKYINDDGSLTIKGQERYEAEVKKNRMKKKDQRVKLDDEESVLKDPNRWVREDLENTKKISEASEKIVKSASDIERLTRPKTKSFDLSNMTDADLRAQINRWQMEDTYARLASDRADTVSNGRKIVKDILEYAGPTLALTSSALAIALAIKQLKD
jgi:hypothetical protein